MMEEGGNEASSGVEESIVQISSMMNTWDLGSSETGHLDSLRLQVFSNDLILERIFVLVDTSQLTTLRQVSKAFYLGTLSRWQSECTISIHGNMDKCEDFLEKKQKQGRWPILGISNMEVELALAPLVFGLGDKMKSYTFRKVRLYGFVMRCRDDGDFWRRMGSTLEELTIVNGLTTWEEVGNVMRVTPKLASLSIHHLVPFFPKARDVFVSKPWMRQGDDRRVQAKIKRFSFKGSVASWLEFEMESFSYISECESVSIEWVPEKEEEELALEWAHLIYPYVFDLSERTHKDENGFLWRMTLIPHSAEKYQLHQYPIPEWVSEREEKGQKQFPIYEPISIPICKELHVSLAADKLKNLAPLLNCASQLLERLVIRSSCYPMEHRNVGVNVFQITWRRRYGYMDIANSNFELLTYVKMSVVVVQNFNFLQKMPVLKCLIIENSTHREALLSTDLGDNDDKSERLMCGCHNRKVGYWATTNYICGNKLIRESNELGEGYQNLSLLQFKADMHFNDEHMSILQKWLPNVSRIVLGV